MKKKTLFLQFLMKTLFVINHFLSDITWTFPHKHIQSYSCETHDNSYSLKVFTKINFEIE